MAMTLQELISQANRQAPNPGTVMPTPTPPSPTQYPGLQQLMQRFPMLAPYLGRQATPPAGATTPVKVPEQPAPPARPPTAGSPTMPPYGPTGPFIPQLPTMPFPAGPTNPAMPAQNPFLQNLLMRFPQLSQLLGSRMPPPMGATTPVGIPEQTIAPRPNPMPMNPMTQMQNPFMQQIMQSPQIQAILQQILQARSGGLPGLTSMI